MTTVRGEPGDTREAKGEQPADTEGSHPSDGSPATSQLRKLVRRISVGASFAGLGACLVWLPNTLMTDITKGTAIALLGVLLLLSAVLFAKRPEPADRLVQIIAALRNRTSDR